MKDDLIYLYDCFDLSHEVDVVISAIAPACVICALIIYTIIVSLLV